MKNRLYDVAAGERVVFPEIPCSFDDSGSTLLAYQACVTDALDGLVDAGVIGPAERGRFRASAMRAWNEVH